jgi:hypothetical protein
LDKNAARTYSLLVKNINFKIYLKGFQIALGVTYHIAIIYDEKE